MNTAKTYKTRLKFSVSEKSGNPVAFVYHNPATDMLRGVYEHTKGAKSVVVLAKDIETEVIPGVLYKAEVIPSAKANMYIATKLEVCLFPAKVEVMYVPDALYMVKVVFGHKTVNFDPKDGAEPTLNSYKTVRSYIENRHDIYKKDAVLREFDEAAKTVLRNFARDGYIYQDTAE